MVAVLSDPPTRTPMLDARGMLTSPWARWFGEVTRYISDANYDATVDPAGAITALAFPNAPRGVELQAIVNLLGDRGDVNVTDAGQTWTVQNLSGLVVQQILFGDASGNTGQDADLLWDYTTKRLGVGTAPSESVHTDGNIKAAHLLGNTSAPTIAVGAGAGTGATASVSGNDISGEITLSAGTTPSAAATVFTMTFNIAFASAPRIVLMPSNANAALLSGTTMGYVTTTTTTAVLTSGSVGMTASVDYKWHYLVAQ